MTDENKILARREWIQLTEEYLHRLNMSAEYGVKPGEEVLREAEKLLNLQNLIEN